MGRNKSSSATSTLERADSSRSNGGAYTEVSADVDAGAVRAFLGDGASEPSAAPFADDSQAADEGAAHSFGQAAAGPDGAGSPAPALTGTGFSYRHNWGNRRGQHVLRLNWGSVNSRSRVLVAIGEGIAGGPDNGKFIGSARYTVHNVAPRNGGVDIWVNIEWGSDISIYVDYLVINP